MASAKLLIQRVVIIAIFLGTVSAVCRAVTMEAVGGFGGVMKSYTWTPITVSLQNPSGQAISGYLEINSGEAGFSKMSTYSAKVELPENSRKRYVIYAQPQNIGELKARFSSRGNNITQQGKRIKIVKPGRNLVHVCGTSK